MCSWPASGKRAGVRDNPVARGVVLVLLTVVAYWPALSGEFLWDDRLYVTDNPLIKAGDGLRRFWLTTEFTDYYALSNTSFWLEWRLWGANPVGYHATNLLLHALNALLLWRVLGRLGVPGAWLAGLMFALHPVNVMSVAWISERKNLLSLLFVALAVLAYLRWNEERAPRWYAVALGCFALALLSKTSVVMVPVVLALLVWWRRGNLTWRDVGALAPFCALSLVMGLVTMWFESQHGIRDAVVRPEGWAARLAGTGWAVWFYVSKVLLPVNLMAIYPRWQISAGSLVAWVPLLALVTLVVALRNRRGLLVALGGFVGLLVPVLGFFDIGFMAYSFVADHWVYPAVIAVIAVGCAMLQRWAWLAVLVVGALGVGTWRQAHVWRDDETLWCDTLAKNPAAWMAHNNLGNALLARGEVDAAVRAYDETLRLQPDYANAHYNLGIVLYQHGRFAEAEERFRETARLKSRSAEAHNNLGAALVQLGRTNDAIAEFKLAAQLAPRWAEPRANLQRVGSAE